MNNYSANRKYFPNKKTNVFPFENRFRNYNLTSKSPKKYLKKISVFWGNNIQSISTIESNR